MADSFTIFFVHSLFFLFFQPFFCLFLLFHSHSLIFYVSASPPLCWPNSPLKLRKRNCRKWQYVIQKPDSLSSLPWLHWHLNPILCLAYYSLYFHLCSHSLCLCLSSPFCMVYFCAWWTKDNRLCPNLCLVIAVLIWIYQELLNSALQFGRFHRHSKV